MPRAPAAAPLDSELARSLWSMGMSQGVVESSEQPGEPAPTPAVPSEAAARAPEPASPSASAGPCLPPPPADDVIAWERLDPFAAWEELLARIREQEEFLAAVLSEVGLVALGGGVVKVAAPRGSFAHNELSKHPQMRAQLEQATRDHFGSPFQLELVDRHPALPQPASLVLIAEQRRQRLRAEVDAQARTDPRIGRVVAAFDATIKATRPLQER